MSASIINIFSDRVTHIGWDCKDDQKLGEYDYEYNVVEINCLPFQFFQKFVRKFDILVKIFRLFKHLF